jgi:CheY-like chemotaxis protein
MAPPRILVVDDTPEVRSLVCRILEICDYEVLEAPDGPAAIAVCQNLDGKIDLLLTDVKMPGMDGVELARNVTAFYPSVRVLYISGQCDAEELQPQVSRKGYGFLSKPFAPQLLIEAVEQMLTQSKGAAQAATHAQQASGVDKKRA